MNLQDKLSPHFTYQEAVHSSTAMRLQLDNTPNPEELDTILRTAAKMEEVRSLLNFPITVYPNHRWFSAPAVNKAVGGVWDSQHLTGEAVDFTCPQFGNPLQICMFLITYKDQLGYDQLIYEGTWVHISFNTSIAGMKREPRKQYLNLSGKVA